MDWELKSLNFLKCWNNLPHLFFELLFPHLWVVILPFHHILCTLPTLNIKYAILICFYIIYAHHCWNLNINHLEPSLSKDAIPYAFRIRKWCAFFKLPECPSEYELPYISPNALTLRQILTSTFCWKFAIWLTKIDNSRHVW